MKFDVVAVLVLYE